MNISFWRLGTRSLGRDLRSGELRLLMVAVTLAVAALTAVGFFADRLKAGLQRDARQLLGGDAVISSNNLAPAAFAAKARALGLEVVQTMSFPTMARAPDAKGGAAKLVALKVVEPGYPLRGRLTVANQSGAPEVFANKMMREITGNCKVVMVWIDGEWLLRRQAVLINQRSAELKRPTVAALPQTLGRRYIDDGIHQCDRSSRRKSSALQRHDRNLAGAGECDSRLRNDGSDHGAAAGCIDRGQTADLPIDVLGLSATGQDDALRGPRARAAHGKRLRHLEDP